MTQKIRGTSEDFQYISIDDPSLVFTTYDLGVSSALMCVGFELLSLDKENPRKALFVFRKDDGIEDSANLYLTNKLNVRARSYFDMIKALKNRLYGSL